MQVGGTHRREVVPHPHRVEAGRGGEAGPLVQAEEDDAPGSVAERAQGLAQRPRETTARGFRLDRGQIRASGAQQPDQLLRVAVHITPRQICVIDRVTLLVTDVESAIE
jgi:hypothetical protein